ncbi:hypothetical protein [Pandoraea apista]|uniref:hypothetical protein n=1 Tax=Pandoraea apista TaxID=93218 RepID=UPI0012E2E0E1|nr:hypothetical protein [Pandoraea apista]
MTFLRDAPALKGIAPVLNVMGRLSDAAFATTLHPDCRVRSTDLPISAEVPKRLFLL